MTFEEKWDYFNQFARFNTRTKWVAIATSFVKDNAASGITEFSFKSSHQDIYFNRIHIRFRQDHNSYYEQWHKSIVDIGRCWKVTWADEDTRSFFKDFDWSICDAFCGGFDLRPQKDETRLKLWASFHADKARIRQLIKNYPFEQDHLAPYWKKYAQERILIGWVYQGSGQVSWRVYPELPSQYLLAQSKDPIVRQLGPLSTMLASCWPSRQPLIHWGNITHKEEFLKRLKTLLSHPEQPIALARDFQEHGMEMSLVSTNLSNGRNSRVTESNFYFK